MSYSENGPWLVIDWTRHGLTVLEADITGDSIDTHGESSWTWPENGGPDAPDRLVEWFRHQVQERGWCGRRAIVVLPRSVATLKVLDLPPVSDAELPELVMLQAESRVSTDLSEIVVDFAVGPRTPGDRRLVLVASCPRGLVDLVERAVASAGLVRKGLVLSELCRPPASLPPAEGIVASLRTAADRIELTLSWRGLPIVSSTLGLEASDTIRTEEVLGTLDRLWSGLPESARLPAIDTLLVEGRNAESLATALAAARPFSVFHLPAPPGVSDVGGRLVSVLAEAHGGGCVVDWSRPKRPRNRGRDRARRAVVIAFAAATALFWGWSRIAEDARAMDARVTAMRSEVRSLSELVERGAAILEANERMDEWERHNSDWGGLLTRIRGLLPERDDLLLTGISADIRGDLPILRLKGRARNAEVVTGVHKALLDMHDDMRFRPGPVESRSDDSDYPVPFDLEIYRAADSDEVQDATSGSRSVDR
jgi:hypothetical protein